MQISEWVCVTLCVCVCVFAEDVPGTDYRIATISGTPDACQRAKKWVDDLIAEVPTLSPSLMYSA